MLLYIVTLIAWSFSGYLLYQVLKNTTDKYIFSSITVDPKSLFDKSKYTDEGLVYLKRFKIASIIFAFSAILCINKFFEIVSIPI